MFIVVKRTPNRMTKSSFALSAFDFLCTSMEKLCDVRHSTKCQNTSSVKDKHRHYTIPGFSYFWLSSLSVAFSFVLPSFPFFLPALPLAPFLPLNCHSEQLTCDLGRVKETAESTHALTPPWPLFSPRGYFKIKILPLGHEVSFFPSGVASD